MESQVSIQGIPGNSNFDETGSGDNLEIGKVKLKKSSFGHGLEDQSWQHCDELKKIADQELAKAEGNEVRVPESVSTTTEICRDIAGHSTSSDFSDRVDDLGQITEKNKSPLQVSGVGQETEQLSQQSDTIASMFEKEEEPSGENMKNSLPTSRDLISEVDLGIDRCHNLALEISKLIAEANLRTGDVENDQILRTPEVEPEVLEIEADQSQEKPPPSSEIQDKKEEMLQLPISIKEEDSGEIMKKALPTGRDLVSQVDLGLDRCHNLALEISKLIAEANLRTGDVENDQILRTPEVEPEVLEIEADQSQEKPPPSSEIQDKKEEMLQLPISIKEEDSGEIMKKTLPTSRDLVSQVDLGIDRCHNLALEISKLIAEASFQLPTSVEEEDKGNSVTTSESVEDEDDRCYAISGNDTDLDAGSEINILEEMDEREESPISRAHGSMTDLSKEEPQLQSGRTKEEDELPEVGDKLSLPSDDSYEEERQIEIEPASPVPITSVSESKIYRKDPTRSELKFLAGLKEPEPYNSDCESNGSSQSSGRKKKKKKKSFLRRFLPCCVKRSRSGQLRILVGDDGLKTVKFSAKWKHLDDEFLCYLDEFIHKDIPVATRLIEGEEVVYEISPHILRLCPISVRENFLGILDDMNSLEDHRYLKQEKRRQKLAKAIGVLPVVVPNPAEVNMETQSNEDEDDNESTAGDKAEKKAKKTGFIRRLFNRDSKKVEPLQDTSCDRPTH